MSIDFDGTVTDVDITDAVIQLFAKPGWEEAEKLWEAGLIGSRECLETQMALINSSLDKTLEYIDRFTIDETFVDFINFLKKSHIPFGIISDGFQIYIERLLKNAGLKHIPIFANQLKEEAGKLKTLFPHTNKNCSSGICKCVVAKTVSNGLPIIHIGDGRSDFCISEKVLYVFSKGKLTDFCKSRGIPHSQFNSFNDIEKSLKVVFQHAVAYPENYSMPVLT